MTIYIIMFGFTLTCTCIDNPTGCGTFGSHYCICQTDPSICKALIDHPCTCNKNTSFCKSNLHLCTCRASIDLCKSDKHNCSCEISTLCKVEDNGVHECVCINNSSICKSNTAHICICSLKNPHACKSVDRHDCGCKKISFLCKVNEHICICNEKPYLCMSTDHMCICKIKPYMCKVDYYHDCVCDIFGSSRCNKIHNHQVDKLFGILFNLLETTTTGSDYRDCVDKFYNDMGEYLSTQTYDVKLYETILKRNYLTKITS